MEVLAALLFGVFVGVFIVRYQNSQPVPQKPTSITEDQKFRRARELKYVERWDPEVARNANVVSNP